MAKSDLNIWIRDYRIPVRVRRHWQPTIKFSFTSKHAQISLPKYFTQEAFQAQLDRLHKWVKEKSVEHPELLERFKQKSYTTGQIFKVRGTDYTLELNTQNRKTIGIKISGQLIKVTLPEDRDLNTISLEIPKSISRAFGKLYHEEVTKRVQYLNKCYFNERINNVKLKYTRSNWGSCSSKRNINLSTRLLMAPQDILDYVIIHELAHLKEMNHSKKFWTIVERAMPDYKQKEAWLKTNGGKLVF